MRGPPSRVLIGLSRPARLPMARTASSAIIRIRAYFAARFGYAVRYLPVGDDDPEVGPPTQMGIFTRNQETRP